MLVFLRKWVLRIAFWLCWPLPIKHRVVFASNSSASLRGNLNAIHRELVRRDPDVQVVVHLHRAGGGLGGKLGTLRAALVAEYYLATSSVFVVDDYYFPLYVAHPKSGTTVIQTWHACGAFKKIGYSLLNKSFGASPALVRQVDIHSNYDYCLIASAAALPHYSEAFRQPPERFVSLGMPSTDVLFDSGAQARSERRIRKRFELPEGKRIILYAPTFRGDTSLAATYSDYLDIDVMRKTLAEEYILLLKLHPFVARAIDISAHNARFAFDVSAHGNINELMLMSDVMITDYSSVIFEYSLLSKPMVFFAPDAEAYQRERGFYFDYETGVPGPVFADTADVAVHIRDGGFDIDRVREFADEMFDVADGHASERVVDELILPHI